ncbi:hypothetical protein [Granulicella arctica]|uniref:hypothetical protein n=1 Tax=Granulicella arctica TaxID=940613 RepID=UPI0021E06367|nr:hypothetical protein [Granulicella arctica]
MKAFHEYWTFSAIRGALTLLAGLAILTLPQATATMLSIPVLITLSILCLATYSVFDAGVMILLAKLLPRRATHRNTFYGQALIALVAGALLFLVGYGLLNLKWLMWLAASQAALAAVAEFIVARDTHRQYGCLSCYATSIVLAASAVTLPFAAGWNADRMSLALAGYVSLYGLSQFFLGARMLFVEYRSGHPAAIASGAWRADMLEPTAPPLQSLASRKVCLNCDECPADTLCHDDSLAGQVARVTAARPPAIVLTLRVDALLNPPKVLASL